jgi:arylsulfatase A-like enzyme
MTQKSYVLLLTAALLTMLPGCGSRSGQMTDQDTDRNTTQPNIILMYIDDLNFDQLGFAGGEVLTPNIDALASDGIILDRFYATSPVCTPSRFSVLTGKYAGKCLRLQKQYPVEEPAFIRWNTNITEGELTVAHLLKAAGYTTGIVGKYHLHGNEGFQRKNPENPDVNDPQVLETLEHNYKLAREDILETAGFDFAGSIYANNLHTLELPVELEYHNQDWVTAGALDFIESNAGRPFFLYFSTTIPHGPPPLASMEVDTRVTPAGFLDEPLNVQPSREDVFRRVAEAGLDRGTAPMTWLDDAVGAVLNKLDEKGIGENTLIIFASDHGSPRGKMTLYEDGAHCPAFVYWKGNLPAGKRNSELTANIDVVPTILDAAGVEIEPGSGIDGQSWLPLLKGSGDLGSGEAADWRESLYLEVTYTRGVVTRDRKYIAVRYPSEISGKITEENRRSFNQEGSQFSANNPDGKMVARYQADKDFPGYFDDDQLYDLANDPGEQQNRAGEEAYREDLNRMQELLSEYSRKIPHRFGEY